jgi:radical SAM superfamily enzyme YgiQ (UPF0313 family)
LQPGIAAVAGYAKEQGLNIEILDANVTGLEYVMKSIDKEKAEKAIAILKDEKSYSAENFTLFHDTKKTIEELTQEASRRNGEQFSFHRNTMFYIPKHEATSRQGLAEAIANPEENLFYEYFKNELIPQIKEKYSLQGFKAIGIGMTDRKQAVEGFIIASMIKKELPDIKIIMGGNFISRGREAVLKDDEVNRILFENFDYMIYLEADKSFTELAKAINEGKEKEKRESIDKLIWREDNKIFHTEMHTVTNVKTLPSPSFDGLQYWTPEATIAYNFQRGCNYGKCTFCGLMAGYDGFAMRSDKNPDGFIARRKHTDDIIEDLKELKGNGYNYINFTDETFFAEDMERISKRLIEEHIDIRWTAYARVENKFTDQDFCRLIAKAGCDFLQFGVESNSVQSLKLMHKGVDNVNAYTILKNTHEAGIMNHVFLLVGYPGETIEDALKLFTFLEDTKDYTFTIKPTWYKLSRDSPDSYNPDATGIKRTYTEGDLAPNLHFQKTNGMSKKAAEAANRLLESWVRRNHEINYVAGTYCYGQRFFSGYKTILDVADKIKSGEISRDVGFTPQAPYTTEEEEALKTVWNELLGKDFHRMQLRYNQGNRNPRFMENYNKMIADNLKYRLISENYPTGFNRLEEIAEFNRSINNMNYEQNL